MIQVDLLDKEDDSLETYRGYWRNTHLYPEGIAYGLLLHKSKELAIKRYHEVFADCTCTLLDLELEGKIVTLRKTDQITYLGPIPCK